MTGLDKRWRTDPGSDILKILFNKNNEGRERGQEVSSHAVFKDDRLMGKIWMVTIHGLSDATL
jgi:hypothetical protein